MCVQCLFLLGAAMYAIFSKGICEFSLPLKKLKERQSRLALFCIFAMSFYNPARLLHQFGRYPSAFVYLKVIFNFMNERIKSGMSNHSGIALILKSGSWIPRAVITVWNGLHLNSSLTPFVVCKRLISNGINCQISPALF